MSNALLTYDQIINLLGNQGIMVVSIDDGGIDIRLRLLTYCNKGSFSPYQGLPLKPLELVRGDNVLEVSHNASGDVII